MEDNNIKIIEFDPVYAEETVTMWRQSKERAIAQKEMHSFENHVFFLNNILNKDNKIYIAIGNNIVVGMIAFNENELNQLYIHIDYQGKGLGRRFLELAKANSNGKLTLFTFEINDKAQHFYEKNGFKIIGSGNENEENLNDIKYVWVDKSVTG
ncbi:GNAT family N-acetyltransferase [Clostridium sp. CS001]|uniref:GNAT family N-acetyltransferase n=1 Tax=Clostridium sp. CS001 TaxID=2880648 RepID=UPI001CF19801|nr:GNAT family N-acetyltransferase [Clostridium sp. CS001]MCB2291519.1 GNAT family N-acetyltransferase [Clostridium sp. CS001]